MRFRWNGRSRVAVAAWVASACVLAVGPAQADDPSVSQIESRLAQSRAHLNDLYAASASAASQFDTATRQLAEANQNVARERTLVRKTNAQLSDQSEAIATLTVEQLQSQTDIQRLSTMLRSGDPQDLLQQAAAYDSAAEAMSAQIDELTARTAVHEAAQHRFEQARTSQQQAVDQLSDNRAAINAAIVRSQTATRAAESERSRLLRQLAAKKQESLAAVTAEQQAKTESDASDEHPGETDDPTTSTPKPEHQQESKPGPEPPASSDESASSEPDGVWDKIAKCESGGNWHINTGNGYYGGLQFSAATWKSVGGPGLPHQYSREVQIKYAKILQARSGWGQWSCAGARFD